MLIPRFSLKRLLIAVTVSGVMAYVLAQAVRGSAWGIAVSVALATLVATAGLYAVTFLLAWGISRVGVRARKRHAASPFATHTPPPQILKPRDPL